jgi:hypothetical protein
MTFDNIHIVLITGFVAFMASIATHVLTKWHLAGRYITREEFVLSIEKLTAQCQFNQVNCPIRGMQKDITEIKGIQSKRTSDLEALMRRTNRRRQVELNIWRAILEGLNKNVHEQNEILSPLEELN